MGQEASRWKVCAELEKILFVIVWCGYVDIWYCALKPWGPTRLSAWVVAVLQITMWGTVRARERQCKTDGWDLCIALLLSEGESRQISARRPLRNCEGFIRRTLRLMIVAGARQSTCKSAVWLHKCHRLYKGLCGVSAESIVSEQRRDRENKLWIPQ